ncbi:hypothetical protein Back2_22370 [Nocardioides baekrokdamisoli]|uniref:Antitoxin n=1 Tax=Nocardioides baekrokdamisoli TaxID=1804624 RepID=A0A3G9IFW8_9ACTN|nr:type II toxin-antitoxin system prevent-host-death family antitoxin [Nocardioides baekrokdamisoli]BBH17950.1 hypothetical protein Back2_22370 [Nocardioides baekrokdamisoli]
MSTPTTLSQRELRNNSAQVLRDVEAGQSFIITNHGRPVGRLVPIQELGLPIAVPANPIRPATEIVGHKVDRSSAEILDELRADRF